MFHKYTSLFYGLNREASQSDISYERG